MALSNRLVARCAPGPRGLLGLVLGSVLLGNLAAQQPAAAPYTSSDPSALKIVALHLQARGGEAAIRALPAFQRRAALREGRNDYTLEWTWHPAFGAREAHMRDHLGRHYERLRVRHGEIVWGHDISPQRTRPGLLRPAEVAEFAWNTQLHVEPWRPFTDGTGKGYVFTYDGTKTIRDRPCYFIRTKHPNGRIVYYAFDQKTFLLVALQYEGSFAGQKANVLAAVSGVERIGGVLFETGYDFYQQGKRFMHVRFEPATVNPAIEEASFKKPYVHPRNFGN